MNEAEVFKQNLLEHTELLCSTFKKKETEVIAAIQIINGTKENMYTQLITQLGLPFTVETIVVLDSIFKSHLKKDFWDHLADLFK